MANRAERAARVAILLGIGEVARRAAVNITAELVETTPVDTGHARANWVPSLGSPHAGEAGSREAPSTSAQSAGILALQTASPEALARQEVHVTNNVPYILRLNDGHSQQAPAGFIEAAVLAGIRSLQ